MKANINWIGFIIPLGLCLFYGYKIFFKKQKTASNGFMLGIMVVLLIISLAKIAEKYILN